ncbi:MAG: nuclear transport factor 2 family protein [Thermoproteota archaeon]
MGQNVDLVKKFYELFKMGDPQHLKLCHDDIEWVVMEGMPYGGRHVGKKAVFEDYFPKLFSSFAEFHAVTDRFFDAKDTVVVTGEYEIVSKSGKKIAVPFAHFYNIENNLITKFRQFTDTQKIREVL